MSRRFVLVKSYYGLGGDLCVLLGAWQLARQLGRELIVDWSGGRYGTVDDGNLFRQFFTEPDFLCPADVPGLAEMSVFPPEWVGRTGIAPVTYLAETDLTQSRPDMVPLDCAADCIVITRDSRDLLPQIAGYSALARSLQLQPAIQAEVDALAARLAAHRYSIGIHFRHGNGEKKVMAPDPRWFRNRINGKLKQLDLDPASLALFVATDCQGTLDYFRQYYPNVIDLPKAYRPNGSGAMHVARDDLGAAEKIQMAREALIDLHTLAACKTFVGSRGYFSIVVRLLREDRGVLVYSGVRVISPQDLLASHRPAGSDAVFGPALRRLKMPVDGLLAAVTGETRTLHYYEDELLSVPLAQPALSADEQMAMRRRIVARRTY